MPEPTRILLWTDAPGPYPRRHRGRRPDRPRCGGGAPAQGHPHQAQRADTEAMLAWGAPPGLLPHMPKLRWAQALTAGVERWLALPDLPPSLTLTCARGTHRESMAENILGALFHLTKPYAAIVAGPEAQQVGPPRRHTAGRQDAGHPRPRRHRPGGGAASPPRSACASSAPSGAPRAAAARRRGAAARADRRGAGAVRLRAAAAARDAGDRELHRTPSASRG